MNIEHSFFLSWFSASRSSRSFALVREVGDEPRLLSLSSESHEQDGERLRVACPQTASGDPAMAFEPSSDRSSSFESGMCRQHIAAGPCAAEAIKCHPPNMRGNSSRAD
jgi:hypothetical protein